MANPAVERTQQWREMMREKGFVQTILWLKIADKRLLEDHARQRHQSLAECIVDAVKTWPRVAGQRTPSTAELATEVARLKRRIDELSPAPSSTATASPEPESQSFMNPESGELTSLAPHPDWIVCHNKRHWKAPTGECKPCAKARKDRNRKGKGKNTDISLETASFPDDDHVLSSEVPLGTTDNTTEKEL